MDVVLSGKRCASLSRMQAGKPLRSVSSVASFVLLGCSTLRCSTLRSHHQSTRIRGCSPPGVPAR
jgi:hypothetical protein